MPRARAARVAVSYSAKPWPRLIGVGLEIGDEAARAGAPRNAAARALELRGERRRVARARGEGLVVAESAAADALAAVAIGAGEAGIERDLVHPLAVPLQHGAAEGVDALGEAAHAAVAAGFPPVSR